MALDFPRNGLSKFGHSLEPGRPNPYSPSWRTAMRPGPLSSKQLEHYERDGYLLVERMFDDEEIGLLLRSAREDRELDRHSFGKADGEGGRVRLSLWNHPGE